MQRIERQDSSTRFAICVDNANYKASDAARDGDIRIIDESGDYFYPMDFFVAIEQAIR